MRFTRRLIREMVISEIDRLLIGEVTDPFDDEDTGTLPKSRIVTSDSVRDEDIPIETDPKIVNEIKLFAYNFLRNSIMKDTLPLKEPTDTEFKKMTGTEYYAPKMTGMINVTLENALSRKEDIMLLLLVAHKDEYADQVRGITTFKPYNIKALGGEFVRRLEVMLTSIYGYLAVDKSSRSLGKRHLFARDFGFFLYMMFMGNDKVQLGTRDDDIDNDVKIKFFETVIGLFNKQFGGIGERIMLIKRMIRKKLRVL